MTGLEALKTIKIKCHPNSNPSPLVDNALDIVEKSLKALEIIKEKNVDVKLLKLSTNLLDYYTRVKHSTGENTELTEEEFELLRSVLE